MPATDVRIHGAYVRRVARAADSLEDLIFDTVSAALDAWAVGIGTIDSIVTASSDQLDGRAISVMVTGASVGGYRRDLINLSSDAAHALYVQAARVMAGRTRLGLVVSWGKPSESPLPVLDRLAHEPFFARPVAPDRGGALGLEVASIRARYEHDPAAARAIAAKNAENAQANPRSITFSGAARGLGRGEGLSGHPQADGCVALLVGAATGPSSGPSARISGMGLATASTAADWQLRPWEAIEVARTRAYARAGIGEPRDQLAFAEVCDLTPWHELMAYEVLGLTDAGSASALALSGATRRDGALPVNASGGMAAGDIDFAGPLVGIAEAALQLLGEAGPVSVEGSRCAVQASASATRQMQSVFVLERVE